MEGPYIYIYIYTHNPFQVRRPGHVRIFRVRRVSGHRPAGDGVSAHWALSPSPSRTFPCRRHLHRRPEEAGICKNAADEQCREKTLFIRTELPYPGGFRALPGRRWSPGRCRWVRLLPAVKARWADTAAPPRRWPDTPGYVKYGPPHLKIILYIYIYMRDPKRTSAL